MDLVCLYLNFSTSRAKQSVNSSSLALIEPVGDAKIAEDWQFQAFQSYFRVAKYDVIVIIGDALPVLHQLEHQLVGQADDHTRTIGSIVRRDWAFGVACEKGSVWGLDNEKQVGVVVDVEMEIYFAVGVVAEEEASANDAHSAVGFEGVLEEQFVVVVVLEYVAYEERLKAEERVLLLFSWELGGFLFELML